VLSRLARARERLRKRLVQRGITLTGAALAAVLTENAVSAAVPSPLVAATASAAMLGKVGTSATPAAILAEGVMKAMFLDRVRSWAVLLFVLGIAGAGAGMLAHRALAERQTAALPASEAPPKNPAPAEKKEEAIKAQAADKKDDDPLPPGAAARLGRLRFRHGEVIRCLAFSPDGKLLASAGENLKIQKDMEDKTICLWDAETGKERARLQGHDGTLWSLAFSPDGKTLAATSTKGIGVDSSTQLTLWDVATGKPRRRIRGPHPDVGGIRPVAFAPDGKTLAFAGEDGALRLWETGTGKEIRPLPIKGHACSLVFSRDGKVLAVGDYGGVLHRWDLDSGKELDTVTAHKGWIRTVAFSADDKLLFSLADGGELRLWEADTGKPFASLNPMSGVVSAAFSPRGRTLALLRNKLSQAEPAVVHGQVAQPMADAKQMIQLWNVERDPKPIRTIAIVPSETERHSGDYFDSLRNQNKTCFVAFSPDGNSLATADRDGAIRLWDAAGGEERSVSASPGEAVHALAWERNGKTLLSGGNDRTVRFWDPRRGEQRRSFPTGRAVTRLRLSHDEKLLATVDRDTISLWRTGDGSPCGGFAATAPVLSKEVKPRAVSYDVAIALGFSGEDKALAVASSHVRETGHILGPTIITRFELWDIAAGKPLRPARDSLSRSHRRDQLCRVFSMDGKIAAGYCNGQLFIWDAATDKETLVSRDPRVGARVVALSPDGKVLATGAWQPGKQGEARDTSSITLWKLDTKEIQQPTPKASHVPATPNPKLRELDKRPGYVTSLAFSPDGKLLASAAQHQQDPSATLRLWDIATGKEMRHWDGHRDRVNALAFSPGGDRLASASADGTVLVWKVE
jgi:WD40 repeat protein